MTYFFILVKVFVNVKDLYSLNFRHYELINFHVLDVIVDLMDILHRFVRSQEAKIDFSINLEETKYR